MQSHSLIRERTQRVWDKFYSWRAIWQRSACTPNLHARVAFSFLSLLYRQMYAGQGISTDSARRKKSKAWAAHQCKKLFQASPMPELAMPSWDLGLRGLGEAAFAGAEGAQVTDPFTVID